MAVGPAIRARKSARVGGLAVVAVVAALAVGFDLGATARAELSVSVYGGWNGSHDSDVSVLQGAADFTIQSVPWDGLSFTFEGGPPYYGVRGTYWLPNMPNLGIGLDYNHAKAQADPNAVSPASGTVGTSARVGDVFSLLEFTDGLNMLFATLIHRRQGERFTPYVGVGLGLAIPHVEVQLVGAPTRTFEYQITGVAAEVMAGLEMKITDRLGWFGEYKFSYSEVDADLDGGGSLETTFFTNHVITGLTFHFQRPPSN